MSLVKNRVNNNSGSDVWSVKLTDTVCHWVVIEYTKTTNFKFILV